LQYEIGFIKRAKCTGAALPMTKWIVEGSLVRAGSEGQTPKHAAEPFLTDEGAKSFARLLNENGYRVTVRVFDDEEELETMTGLEVIRWMSSRPD
jgi:hypothetical protein